MQYLKVRRLHSKVVQPVNVERVARNIEYILTITGGLVGLGIIKLIMSIL